MWHLTKSGGSGGCGWKSLAEREEEESTLEDEIGREFNLSIERGLKNVEPGKDLLSYYNPMNHDGFVCD